MNTDLFVQDKEKWRKFYQKHFALDVSFADVIIPRKPTEGEWRLIIIAAGLTMNQVYDRVSALFTCSRYSDDLDASVTKNVRDTKTSYAIWVRDEVEPDNEFLGKSTNQVDPDMLIGVTLLERMIHEIDYFSVTGKHLDIKEGSTFCSGSRSSNGHVPSVRWDMVYQEVGVGWSYLGLSDSCCGIRRAITL
jgi:hypothetical protein